MKLTTLDPGDTPVETRLAPAFFDALGKFSQCPPVSKNILKKYEICMKCTVNNLYKKIY